VFIFYHFFKKKSLCYNKLNFSRINLLTKKILIQIALFIFVSILTLVGYVIYPKVFEPFENKLNDSMFLFRGEKKADENVVIIDIDEKSLKELGQWPWSRNKVAKVLQNLTDYGVAIIGLDVVFAEYDSSSPKKVLTELGINSKDAKDYDKILANTIASTPTIVGYVFYLTDDGFNEKLSPKNSAILIEKNKPEKSFLIKPYRTILNIPEIQEAAYSNGYFNTIPDQDGIVRSIPMLMDYDGALYPSLSLEMIRILLDERKITLKYFNQGAEYIQIGDVTIPTDTFGRMMINYRGEQHRYDYISAVDIYNKQVSPERLAGKIALLGTSASGLLDLRSTPFDSVYPGVEVHATAIDNILNGDFLSKPPWIIGTDIVDILVCLIIAFVILLIPSALLSFGIFTAFIFGIFYLHYYYLTTEGLLLNTFFPVIGVSLLFIIGESINYYFETKQKEKIKKKFAAKVSDAVVEELIKSNSDNILEAKEENITIFFSDIRGFTSISEQMGSAKELINLLNQYMTPMVEIIAKHNGTVDKFIGDAIMAYWNAPVHIKDHADEALKASIEQIFKLQELNIKFKQENKPNIDIGIGLNTGDSIVGEMGSFGRSDYTCIGDPVNLASRAEGLCKPYGAKIILTEFTKALLTKDEYFIRELDVVRVKGKEEPVKIYECIGYENQTWVKFSKEENNQYQEALALYKNSDFKSALDIFEQLNEQNTHKVYALYSDRCKHYIDNPPSNFDGVFTFVTK
jgi:adenylate cyclase